MRASPGSRRPESSLHLNLSFEEAGPKRRQIHLQICCDIPEDAAQGAYLEGVMTWDGDVMNPSPDLRGRTKVAPRLPGDVIPVPLERPCELVPAQIAGELHTAMSSSFTRWRRIMRGRSASSKCH